MLRGGEELLVNLSNRLGIKPGQTTPDGRVTLEFAECLTVKGAPSRRPRFGDVTRPSGVVCPGLIPRRLSKLTSSSSPPRHVREMLRQTQTRIHP